MNKEYYGIKRISARPMTRAEYNDFRGWEMPADEDGEDEGYLVEYSDKYVSWSPKDVFDEAYQLMDKLKYPAAMYAMLQGHKIRRASWSKKLVYVSIKDTGNQNNPKNIFITRVSGDDGYVDTAYKFSPDEVFADDWMVVSD